MEGAIFIEEPAPARTPRKASGASSPPAAQHGADVAKQHAAELAQAISQIEALRGQLDELTVTAQEGEAMQARLTKDVQAAHAQRDDALAAAERRQARVLQLESDLEAALAAASQSEASRAALESSAEAEAEATTRALREARDRAQQQLVQREAELTELRAAAPPAGTEAPQEAVTRCVAVRACNAVCERHGCIWLFWA